MAWAALASVVVEDNYGREEKGIEMASKLAAHRLVRVDGAYAARRCGSVGLAVVGVLALGP